MFRKLFMLFLLMPIFSASHPVRVFAQDALPTTKEAWIEKLSSLTLQNSLDYQIIQQFTAQDHELMYSVLRDSWTKIKNFNVRSQIVATLMQGNGPFGANGVDHNNVRINPRLLDILTLWLESAMAPGPNNVPPAQVNFEKQQTLQAVLEIAFQDISGLADFKKWRASVADKPITLIVQENSRRVVHDLENGTVDQKLKTLALLKRLTYYTGTSMSNINGVITRGHDAAGLMKIRRDALIEAKLPAALGKLLRPENPVSMRRDSLRVLARFQPDDSILRSFESDFKRELPPLMEQPAEAPDPKNPFRQPDNLTELLGAFTGDWAIDLIVDQLQKSAAKGSPDWQLTNAIQYLHNPRVIPALIGLMEVTDTSGMGYNPYENALRQIAGVGWDGSSADRTHDPMWWRVWWHANKKRYPLDVQNLHVPHFHKANAEAPAPIASQRRIDRGTISEDPKRSYWLLSPGSAPPTSLTDVEKAAVANSGLKKLAAVKPDRPGLIVMLSDGDTLDSAMLDSWLDVCDALNRRYFLAIAIRPKWSEKTADRWLTLKDRSGVPAAEFTTESFVEQIVRQMQSNAALDPNRIYLAAEGKAGIAGYACALQKSTPFRGFCLLSTPFRSSMLPPLSTAKNRRFFLALGIQGSGGTDTLAAAAEPILRQQGAVVSAEQIKTGSLAEGIEHGIHWLER